MKNKRIKSRGGLPPNKYLSIAQVKKLRQYITEKAANGKRRDAVSETVVDILLNAGLRAAEVCNLEMRDLPHFHGKQIIDVRQGKGCVQRSVEISSALVRRINKFVKEHRKNAKPKSPLFVSERDKKRIGYRSLYSKLVIIGRGSGVGRLTAHMLRHSYAMVFYKQTKDLLGLQQQLGHKDPQTTHIYAKTSSDEMRRQIEEFDL